MLKKILITTCVCLITGTLLFLHQSPGQNETKIRSKISPKEKVQKEVAFQEKKMEKESESIKAVDTPNKEAASVDVQQQLSTHEEIKYQYERLSDGEINQIIKEIAKTIENKNFISKANNGYLSSVEEIEFEGLMRKKESLYLVLADRLVAETEKN